MKRKSERQQLSEDCIYTALCQLMEKMPYAHITITDITKRAGVSRMAYYRNYTDKDDILLRQVDSLIASLVKRRDSERAFSEREFWTLLFTNFRGNALIKNIIQAGLSERLIAIIQTYSDNAFAQYFQWDMDDEENRLIMQYQLGGNLSLIRYVAENASTDVDKIVAFLERIARQLREHGKARNVEE